MRNQIYKLLSFLLIIAFAACQSNAEKAKEIDDILSKSYQQSKELVFFGENIDSIGFDKTLESYLSNPITYKYQLDSLSKLINIKQLSDIKIYSYYTDMFVHETSPCKYYMQYQCDGKTFFKELDDHGNIIEIYPFKEDDNNYYLFLSEADGGKYLRVFEKKGTEYNQTNSLFPYEEMFETTISFFMDNFHFDPETRTVSYDGYEYFLEAGETVANHRTEWILSKYINQDTPTVKSK